MVHLKDIYGDHGLISLVIIKSLNKKMIVVDTFYTKLQNSWEIY